MRSRLAIIAMLVFGMVLSTGGGALAVSGFTSQQDNAAQGQYGSATSRAKTRAATSSARTSPATRRPRTAVRPARKGSQPARQVEAGAQGTGGEELPFTGFAAIPILLGGVALLTSGLVLRKRAADERE